VRFGSCGIIDAVTPPGSVAVASEGSVQVLHIPIFLQ